MMTPRQRALAGQMYGAGGPVQQSLAGPRARSGRGAAVARGYAPDAYRSSMLPFARTQGGQTRLAVPGMLTEVWDALQTANQYSSGQVPMAEANVADVANIGLNLAGTGYTKGLLSGPPPLGMLNQSSWHGGPNKWLPDATGRVGPSLEKVGTGEGAQAYGWGFYSADVQDVGKMYQRELSPVAGETYGWKTHGASDSAKDMLAAYGGDMDKAIAAARDKLSPRFTERLHRLYRGVDDELENIRKLGQGDSPGQLYHLDLPDEDVAKYLDWDAPLSQQPANVKKSLSALLERINAGRVERFGPGGTLISKERFMKMTGEDLQDHLAVTFGRSERAVSEALRDAGIPGLKYFDAKSRPITGQPTAQGTAASLLDAAGGDVDAAIALAHKRISQGNIPADQPVKGGLRDAIEVLKQYGEPRTRNYVTWDQDVLDRVKILEQP